VLLFQVVGNSKITWDRRSRVPRRPLAMSSNWEGDIWKVIWAVTSGQVFSILLGTRRASFETSWAGAVDGAWEQLAALWQLDCTTGGLEGVKVTEGKVQLQLIFLIKTWTFTEDTATYLSPVSASTPSMVSFAPFKGHLSVPLEKWGIRLIASTKLPIGILFSGWGGDPPPSQVCHGSSSSDYCHHMELGDCCHTQGEDVTVCRAQWRSNLEKAILPYTALFLLSHLTLDRMAEECNWR
jgi:hypothetical protein